MNKQKKFLSLLILALGILAAIFFLNRSFSAPKTTDQTVLKEQKTTLTIELSGQNQTLDISQFVGKSALEATLGKADIKSEGTGANAFVTSIAGRMADTKKNEFWELIVNGASAQVGAGSYIVSTGDSLEWKLSTY